MCMLAEGKGFCLAKKKWKVKNMLPVMTVLVRGQLGWGPDVAFGQVGSMCGQFLIFQGCSAFQQILICRPFCTSQFLILISSSSSAQMLTCKFLNSSKYQYEIRNYQILNNCRVQYTAVCSSFYCSSIDEQYLYAGAVFEKPRAPYIRIIYTMQRCAFLFTAPQSMSSTCTQE